MSNRILITGASGNVAKALLPLLLARGADVVAAVHKTHPQPGVKTVELDYTDPASIAHAMQGIDSLYLVVPFQPDFVELSQRAIDAAKQAGVRHIVRISGAGSDANSSHALPRVQGTIDAYLAASGVAYTSIQPANFQQNWVNWYAQGVKDGAVYSPTGQGKTPWVDARDVAEVAAVVLLDPAAYRNRSITLTGPEPLSYADCAAIVAAATGRLVQAVAVPDEAAIESMRQWQLPDWTIEMFMSLNRIIKAGYAETVTHSVEESLGRKARTFAAFAAEHQAAWA